MRYLWLESSVQSLLRVGETKKEKKKKEWERHAGNQPLKQSEVNNVR